MTQFNKILLLLLVCCISSVLTQKVKTQTFGSYEYHKIPEFDEVKKAGVALGFFTLGVLTILAVVLIVKDQVDNVKLYKKRLADYSEELRRLDYFEVVEKQYHDLHFSKKKETNQNE